MSIMVPTIYYISTRFTSHLSGIAWYFASIAIVFTLVFTMTGFIIPAFLKKTGIEGSW